MKIHHTTALGVCDTYEVVTEPPLGYIIWNIGDNAPEGYLPFCRLKFMQPFEGGREIESDTLKAMKCDGAREILAAIEARTQPPQELGVRKDACCYPVSRKNRDVKIINDFRQSLQNKAAAVFMLT